MPQPRPTPADSERARTLGEWRRTLTLAGATALGLCFLTGYMPAKRDVRTLETAERDLHAEIHMLQGVTERLRKEIRAAQDDPMYAEALQRSRTGGALPSEAPTAPTGWRVPALAGNR